MAVFEPELVCVVVCACDFGFGVLKVDPGVDAAARVVTEVARLVAEADESIDVIDPVDELGPCFFLV